MANASSTTQQQVGETCEKIVNDFRDSKTTLEEAIAAISDAIPYDPESPRTHGNAVAAYLRMLSKHDVEKAKAALVGLGRVPEPGTVPPFAPEPDEHESEPAGLGQGTDPVRVTPESALAAAPWVVAAQFSKRELSPSLQATAKFLANSRRFLAQYQASILSTPGRPSIPDSEWTNILCGRAVDLTWRLSNATESVRPPARLLTPVTGSLPGSLLAPRLSSSFRTGGRSWTKRRIIDDIHDFEFKRVELQCLHAHGTPTDARTSMGPIRTARRRQRAPETCRRFNGGHQHDASTCKYTHACDGCGGAEPRTKCSKCKGRA